MKKIYIVLNPEGKVFRDTISVTNHECKMSFASSWFSGWNIHPDNYQSSVIWEMFQKRGFKILEIELPAKLELS